jgi:hypothetical protein
MSHAPDADQPTDLAQPCRACADLREQVIELETALSGAQTALAAIVAVAQVGQSWGSPC